MRQHAIFFFSILKTKKMPVRQRSTKKLHNRPLQAGVENQAIVGRYGQQKTYEVVGTATKKKKNITAATVTKSLEALPDTKTELVSTPKRAKEMEMQVGNMIGLINNLIDENNPKKDTKTTKEKYKKLAAEVKQCIAGYAPCNPLKGMCPPDWENATAYVVKEGIDENKKTYTYRAPCVVKAGILGPYETQKTDDYHRYLQILRLATQQIPEYEKRFGILNAIQSCSTLDNKPELCERVQTNNGSNKCRVDSDKSCKPTLAFLHEQREGVISKLQSMDSSIQTLQKQLKDPIFDQFRNNRTLQSKPDNWEARSTLNQFRLKTDKLNTLLQNRILLLNEVLTAEREANGLEQQHALASANDAICQNRKVNGNSMYGDCILAENGNDLCMVATFGKDREHAYVESLSEEDKKKKMKLDVCVSKDGKGISHIKDPHTGRPQFIDQKEQVVSMPFGPNPRWWASTRNRVMARGLAETFTTDLSGISTDLSQWTTDKILNRANIRTKRMDDIQRMKNELLDLIDNLSVGFQQLTKLTDANPADLIKLVDDGCNGIDFSVRTYGLNVGGEQGKLKNLLGLDESTNPKKGLVYAMYGWGKKLKAVATKLDNPETGSTQEMSSLIGFLTERKEALKGNDKLKDFEAKVIDKISETAQENHKYALAHDIALRFAADKFTAGELVYYHPSNDRVRVFDFPNYKKDFILARAVKDDDAATDNGKFIEIELGNGDKHTVGRYHVRKKYIAGDPEQGGNNIEASILAGRTQNDTSDVSKMASIRVIQVKGSNGEEFVEDQFVKHAIQNGVQTTSGLFSKMLKAVKERVMGQNESLTVMCQNKTHDTISKLQSQLIAMTDTYNNYLKEQGMTTDYSANYMRTRQARGTNSGVISWMVNYGKNMLKRGSMGLFGGEGENAFDDVSSDEESFMSTDGESILSVSSNMENEEESFMSTNLSENISFMSTATPQVSQLSFMSTATPFSQSKTQVSLMSTATRESKNDVSLMSTATPVNVSAKNDSSMLSTEGGTVSFMSTANESKQMMASIPSSEEFMSDVSSISMPSVKSLAASSVDVDRLYEEYYANASSSSSVSHL